MNDGIHSGNSSAHETDSEVKRVSDRFSGQDIEPAGSGGLNSLDLLRAQVTDNRPSPWGDGSMTPTPSGSDRLPDRPNYPVENGVLRVAYGDPNFDAALGQTNYSKVVISGVPKELSPSPWIDEQGKGFEFWFNNQNNPAGSDRTIHLFPGNLKQIEIAQYQGHVYKPVLINVDEMRMAACQAYMKQQNDSGYGSYRDDTSSFNYSSDLAKVSGQALQYQEQLLRESARNSPANPYFHIYLADVLAAEAVQPVLQAQNAGQRAYYDNPYTNGKIAESISESQLAGQITRQYGNLMKPPDHAMPLNPFGLNPYFFNPDAYWCGAAYQTASREMHLTQLKNDVIMGRLPIELPPSVPPRQ